ncbi:hypothetical protein SERLA73DRAFT_175842 [Serpula lacrymans var. lacrymans S7.3]|uniref:RING-type domain-containing protein n=2 Tax=Serpula lacrymans var. lacrymans TaxID=341189 RepID=F8PJF2_SERL3|nr:hypothetical protein SERLA73DRAFT_175842 [Serpula lacrymans var. lacrymans S7.3]
MDGYIARVLEIIPDVQPAHVLSLVEKYILTKPDNIVELILHSLFEDPTYPKIDKKGKRKRSEEDEGGATRGSPKLKVDYGQKDRECKGGPHYLDMALEQLLVDFPYIPKPHIRMQLIYNNTLYAPTYLFLAEEKKGERLPYIVKTVPSRISGKGRARHDPEFEHEREWLRLKLADDAVQNDAAVAEQLNEDECDDGGDGIECGCCFSLYAFDKMVQCPDAHLFCKTCMTSYASTLLGEHNPKIVCMDQSGCKLAFPDSELQRFLTPKLMELYERVKQRKEIEAAGLENLEECPFCEYKVVIDNEQERLFHCDNADCGAVSCRECKKLDHLPKSCKEMEEDKHLNAQHAVEEAMTRALMRNCPKCQKGFIKENGCNKMTCPNCRTVSCYICRQIIQGYEHFGNPPPYSGRVDKNKCSLWDPVERRHAEEVTEAAKRAIEEYKREHPDADEKDIKVDLPPPAPAVPQPPPMLGFGAVPHFHHIAMPPFHHGHPQPGHPHPGFGQHMMAHARAVAAARVRAANVYAPAIEVDIGMAMRNQQRLVQRAPPVLPAMPRRRRRRVK